MNDSLTTLILYMAINMLSRRHTNIVPNKNYYKILIVSALHNSLIHNILRTFKNIQMHFKISNSFVKIIITASVKGTFYLDLVNSLEIIQEIYTSGVSKLSIM